MPEGSPARAVVAAVLLFGLAAGAAWGIAEWRAAAGPASSEAVAFPPRQPADPAGASSPSASVDDDPAGEDRDAEETGEGETGKGPAEEDPAPDASPDDPAPDDGPATGPYAAFAPSHQLTHPDTDPDIRRWYDSFGYHSPDGGMGEWTNKEILWDSLVEAKRAEVAELGPEYDQPLWNNQVAAPASVNVRWGNETTGGRGDFVEFYAAYAGPTGEAIERYWAVLVQTLEDGSGTIFASGLTMDYAEEDYDNYSQQDDEISKVAWIWVLEQNSDE